MQMLQSFSQNYQNFDLSFGVWTIKMYMYSETSNKGHSERGQTSQQGQAENTLDLVYTLYRKSPLKEDNLSTKDKTACPESSEGVHKRFHCSEYL